MKTFVATKLMCITDGKRNCHLSEIRGSEDSLETLEASFSTFAMYGSIATHSLICWAAHHRSCQRPWMSWNSSQPTSLILTGNSGSASLSTARAKATSHCGAIDWYIWLLTVVHCTCEKQLRRKRKDRDRRRLLKMRWHATSALSADAL